MGFRFYRRFRVAPGITLNVGKRNASVSLGARGAHVTIGTAGNRATVGLPGTGMYWTEKLGPGGTPLSPLPPSIPTAPVAPMAPAAPTPATSRRLIWAIALLIGIALLIAMAH
jgi:hypothetical protein